MSTTKISWATHTDNPAGGCSEARLTDGTMDPACRHCYARLMSARVSAMGASQGRGTVHDGVSERVGGGARWTGVFRWDPHLMHRQFEDMRPGRRTFVGSMTDLWHPEHDPQLLIHLAVQLRVLGERWPYVFEPPVVITLTKRVRELLTWQRARFAEGLLPYHWAGFTAGNQAALDERAPVMEQVNAHGPLVLSAEPLTGPLVLSRSTLDKLGWVIVGAESRQGRPGAPMDLDWVRSLRDQCMEANIPFFFKQAAIDGKVVSSPELDGRVWAEVPPQTRGSLWK